MVGEGVQQLRTGGLRRFLAVVVVDLDEWTILVLQLEVVPVLAADEHAGIAMAQLQVVNALEDLREGFALLEVEAAVVAALGRGATTVEGADVVRVGATDGPTGANGQ
ncbi:hypothetical protein D3C76_1158190 [compost metagenome]